MPVQIRRWVDLEMFRDMGTADLEALARCLRRVEVPVGGTLFRRGERTRTMFAIVEGTVEILEARPDGRNVSLVILGPGEVMGEVALLDGGIRQAVAIARSPTVCVTLDAEGLARLLHECPETARKLMLVMAENLATRLGRAGAKANDVAAGLARGGPRGAVVPEVRKSLLGRLFGL